MNKNNNTDIQIFTDADNVFRVTIKSVIVAALISYVILSSIAIILNITWDDSYISYRFSKNFANDLGLVFNKGEYVEGYSNFLWVLIVGLFAKIGFDILVIGRVLCFIFAFAAIPVIILISRNFTKKFGAVALVAIALLTFRMDFIVHFHSGMETALHLFMLALGFYLYQRQQDKNMVGVGIIAGLLPLIHPAGMLFAVAIIVNELIEGIRSDFKAHLRNLISFIIPIIVIVGGHTIWRHFYYGEWLSNTYYAKKPDFDLILHVLRGIYHLIKFISFNGGLFYYAPAIFFAFYFFKNRSARALSLIAAFYILFEIYSSGDWMPYSRFMVPVVPLILIAESMGILTILSMLKFKRFASAIVIALLVLSGIENNFLYKMMPAFDLLQFKGSEDVRWVRMGKFLGKIKDDHPDLKVAAFAIGSVGYYSEAYIIDMCGITDRHIAKDGVRLMGMAGHERADMQYVLDKEPDILLISTSKDSITCEIRPGIFAFEYPPRKNVRYKNADIYKRISEEFSYRVIPNVGDLWVRKGFSSPLLDNAFSPKTASP